MGIFAFREDGEKDGRHNTVTGSEENPREYSVKESRRGVISKRRKSYLYQLL